MSLSVRSPAEPDDPPPGRPAGSASFGALVALCGALTAVVATVVVGLSATRALSLLGIPDPGALTTYGLPAVRALADLAAALTVGSLLFAAFLTPPQTDGLLDVDGYRAVQRGSWSAVVWACCAALLVPLTVSDTTGRAVEQLWRPELLWRAMNQIAAAEAWRTTTVLALILAAGARVALRWRSTPLLAAGAITAMMPLALSGHSSSGGAHDVATNSLVLHLISSAVWVGGLFAVLAHAMRGGARTDLAARRFSAIATGAFIVIGLSGVINSWVRVPTQDLLTTTYGRLVLAKAAALLALGVLGWFQRRLAVARLVTDPRDRAALIRFGGLETVTFAVTVGLAVGLGRTPPPPPTAEPTPTEAELGYTLSGPPSMPRLLFDWRFDLIYGAAALALAIAYLLGVRLSRERGHTWAPTRTVAWLSGCAVMLAATSSGVGRYAHAVFSVHMGQIMALSILTPILLALGSPVTLVLRALRPAEHGEAPGPREWTLAAVHNPLSRALTHPIAAPIILAGGFCALYLSGIYDSYLDSHAAHLMMNLYFLVAGYMFFWTILGIDPTPRPASGSTRLAMLLGFLTAHIGFGIALITTTTVMGQWYFRGLGLDWNDDLLTDQRIRGGLVWAIGLVPVVIVTLALLLRKRPSPSSIHQRPAT
ncbi:bifunctional copper resistance protein CopD/cytochrome c oxidase assembly protein [Nocardia takedensis]|uniref:bifunctional copper resistance protein CopD/cytochrome c oxidase assembly protein n=1 Tax=Nocardia takedensis TaxID=259390 RepID=UPI0003144407|nr:cytochrome c oxidase assembly protein [Nocardia takedensis]